MYENKKVRVKLGLRGARVKLVNASAPLGRSAQRGQGTQQFIHGFGFRSRAFGGRAGPRGRAID